MGAGGPGGGEASRSFFGRVVTNGLRQDAKGVPRAERKDRFGCINEELGAFADAWRFGEGGLQKCKD